MLFSNSTIKAAEYSFLRLAAKLISPQNISLCPFKVYSASFVEQIGVEAAYEFLQKTLEYEAALDLVVSAPDGRLAAYCLCTFSQEENERTGRQEGYTDPVATHPDFQRWGLARALLLTGLRLLQERGMDTAVLGTSSDNPAMLGTAQSVGFQVQTATCWFSRPVSGVPVTAMC